MSEQRDPPYPAETISRGWRFEVDMESFKRSDTWKLAKTGAMRGALLLLWSEAWQEKPCGTLPDDDELIALMIDMPAATFAKGRSVLRRGWVRASDGRLYHDVITTRVLAMLEKRATDAKRTAESRARRAGVTGVSRVTHGELSSEFDTKHQAPSRKKKNPPTPQGAGRFDDFWAAWPKSDRKGGKGECLGVWQAKGLEAEADAIVAHVAAMSKTEGWLKQKGEFVPAPVVYLRGRRWDGAEVESADVNRFADAI